MKIKQENEVHKVEIHCPNMSPFHSIFMVRRSGIICGPVWGLFPVRGSFAGLYRPHSALINCTGGDNSNKRCLSNTRSQLKSSRKFGSSSRILGIHSRMSRFFSALSRNYRVFPGKMSKCPDSRRNLQIPGTILALSRNSVC